VGAAGVEGGSADGVAGAPERVPVAAPACGIGAAGRWWWSVPRGEGRERGPGETACYNAPGSIGGGGEIPSIEGMERDF
jgi:hypothetical protein